MLLLFWHLRCLVCADFINLIPVHFVSFFFASYWCFNCRDVLNNSNAAEVFCDKYLKHKENVSRFFYAMVASKQHIEQMEATWPEYNGTEDVIRPPAYLSARASDEHGDAAEWVKESVAKDAYMLQLRKQHHVHILNPQTGKREPLTACTRKDNPNLSKGDFLRTLWLIAKAVVLCQGLINRIDMALTGRKSKLGAFHGLMNQESQNATHPAMLVLHRCNSDVQFPYRFPVQCQRHTMMIFLEKAALAVSIPM